MKKVYPVIFTETEEGDFLVEVPDMEILTEGKNIEDAVVMARDAIGMKGIGLEDGKKPIPEASKLSEIDLSKGTFAEEGQSLVALVDIDFDEYRRRNDRRMVRRNVTLPRWLDVAANEAGFNVSQVLREALAERLHVML
jgi:predicted RNase H-like HicB family nuclease